MIGSGVRRRGKECRERNLGCLVRFVTFLCSLNLFVYRYGSLGSHRHNSFGDRIVFRESVPISTHCECKKSAISG